MDWQLVVAATLAVLSALTLADAAVTLIHNLDRD